MKEEQEYIQDLAEIRSIMERTTKFKLLSGWAGILAGIFALTGAGIAHPYYEMVKPDQQGLLGSEGSIPASFLKIILIALVVLALSASTAIYFSFKKARQRGEKLWNATTKRLLVYMGVPLVAGGLLILIFIAKGLFGFLAPISLIFYGLSLYNASKLSHDAIKILGLVQISLGLIGAYCVEHGWLFWSLGFGVAHILYGIFLQYKYER
ncbi:MAG: hypothetical protein IPM48_00185 [Saprospiraceae bacterium]|nr:hypothetical protein [Saprospiraceae bacterium]